MKTIFFDVDNQIDFLYPAGALYVPGAEEIVKQLEDLTRFAASNGIQIISTTDAHSENDLEFKTWKPHCVIGTTGQRKAAGTLLSHPIILTSDPGALGTRKDAATGAPQIIIQKQMLDCFTNPNLRPLLEQLGADRYVVYGVVTEYCVGCAITGLLETGARVELVTDAIKSLATDAELETIRSFGAGGGYLTTVERVTAGK